MKNVYRKNKWGDFPIDAVAWMFGDVNVIAALRGLIRMQHDLFKRSTLQKKKNANFQNVKICYQLTWMVWVLE